MSNAYVCTRCGSVFSFAWEKCSNCGAKLIDTGYSTDSWAAMSEEKKKERIEFISRNADENQRRLYEIEQQKEKEKQDFAHSFNEFYEYDVVTLINKDHGQIDKRKMMEVLSNHAKQGWKLHSVYSNELGKNAIRILGFGVNTTACEDVLIFERRVRTFSE